MYTTEQPSEAMNTIDDIRLSRKLVGGPSAVRGPIKHSSWATAGASCEILGQDKPQPGFRLEARGASKAPAFGPLASSLLN